MVRNQTKDRVMLYDLKQNRIELAFVMTDRDDRNNNNNNNNNSFSTYH
jgi:hypothetical protein